MLRRWRCRRCFRLNAWVLEHCLICAEPRSYAASDRR